MQTTRKINDLQRPLHGGHRLSDDRRIDGSHTGHTLVRTSETVTDSEAAQVRTPWDEPSQAKALQAICEHVDELILLNHARMCEEMVTGHSSADGQSFQLQQAEILSEVHRLLADPRTESNFVPMADVRQEEMSSPPGSGTAVRFRLSRPLVKILKAFGDSGTVPGRMVERAMWNDAAVQDACLILGVRPPGQNGLAAEDRA
ncbi:MAG: hypothetical protein R3C49_24885 [Planctomycetaceae bacterium]